MEGREERAARDDVWRRQRPCLSGDESGERQVDESGARQERAREVRQAACAVVRVRTRGRVRATRVDHGVPLRRCGLQVDPLCDGRCVYVRCAGTVRVHDAPSGHCEREGRGYQPLAAAAMVVIVAVESDVQARQDEHQEEVQERRERRRGPSVPSCCDTTG